MILDDILPRFGLAHLDEPSAGTSTASGIG
jgi:hypothetical protein